MLDAIQTACYNYYQEIPINSTRAVARSAILSFVASLIISNQPHQSALNFSRPLMAASVGALASTINALTAPFFKWMFGNKKYHIHQELIRVFVDLTLTQSIINYGTSHKVNLFAPHLATKLVRFCSFSENIFIKIPLSIPSILINIFSDSAANRYNNYFRTEWDLDIENVSPSVYFTI
ncbi:MAG: hypothetical protein H0V82_13325 [Candidatus Protochlamydia sp.]|nr:hypothetical protein [Candidatus Protochlamydia sp.]